MCWRRSVRGGVELVCSWWPCTCAWDELGVVLVVAANRKSHASNPSARELFLGLLFSVEDFRVFGYVTNTNVKFVIVTYMSSANEGAIKPFFRQLHEEYLRLLGNPFYKINDPIESERFLKSIRRMSARLTR
eukprot:TRINITY_DN65896_c8_g1_i1.p2 TRINITY_DN65896_c8_g1~~TRINITY_DN65896_c8_g1_i1.p2  ORF type:complete len:132 (-),score=37.57 TRINITY_DN65896_c8_g1_i1:119-514(-)